MPTIRAYASTGFLFAVSWLLTAGFAALRWYVGWDTCFGEGQCIGTDWASRCWNSMCTIDIPGQCCGASVIWSRHDLRASPTDSYINGYI